MLEESAVVVAIEGPDAWVQTIRQSACAACSARQGCGQSVLARMSGGRANQVRVANRCHARVGQTVVLGLSESAFLRASMMVYLVPLIGLIAGALCASWLFGGHEGFTAMGGLVSMLAGFVLVSKICTTKQQLAQYNPVMLRLGAVQEPMSCDSRKASALVE